MIYFTCPCSYSWVLNLKDARVMGPFYEGSNPRLMSMEEFDDYYADCYGQITDRITK